MTEEGSSSKCSPSSGFPGEEKSKAPPEQDETTKKEDELPQPNEDVEMGCDVVDLKHKDAAHPSCKPPCDTPVANSKVLDDTDLANCNDAKDIMGESESAEEDSDEVVDMYTDTPTEPTKEMDEEIQDMRRVFNLLMWTEAQDVQRHQLLPPFGRE